MSIQCYLKAIRLKTMNHPYALTVLKQMFICWAVSFPLATLHSAELYKWMDSSGVTHFTDKPPKGVNAQKLKYKTVTPTEAGQVKVPNEQDPDHKRCEDEKKRLLTLQSERRVFLEDRDGSKRELSVAEIKDEIAFAQRAIEKFCKKIN